MKDKIEPEKQRVLRYAESVDIPWSIPSWLSRFLFCAAVGLTALVILTASITECLNFHFDSFFPRRTFAPEGKAVILFKKNLVDDEGGWRDWRVMVSRDITYYWKPLAANDLAEMHARIAENGKWNFFVGFVRWSTFPELAAIVAVLAMTIPLNPRKNSNVTWGQRRIVMICVGFCVAVVLLILLRGYVVAILE